MGNYREVTQEIRDVVMREGICVDINGNLPAHPGYTGIHRHGDGSYWFRGEQITDADIIYKIEHREEPAPCRGFKSKKWLKRLRR